MDRTAGFDGFLHKGDQTFCRGIRYPPHPDPSDAFPILLSSHNNQSLILCLTAPDASLRTAEIGFVHLHSARQPVSSRSHHRPPQLMQPSPSGLVAPQAEDALQAQSTPSALLAGHEPHRLKPGSQRLPRAFENRSCDRRGLPLTSGASEHAPRGHPGTPSVTRWALEAVRPPKPSKIGGARRLRRKPLVELLNCPRIIHSADRIRATLAHHYILCLRERNG